MLTSGSFRFWTVRYRTPWAQNEVDAETGRLFIDEYVSMVRTLAERPTAFTFDTSVAVENGRQSHAIFTPSEVAAMTVAGDASRCYYTIFESTACASPGGVYHIDPTFYASHGGGSFGTKTPPRGCGTTVERWASMSSAAHDDYFRAQLQAHLDLSALGVTFARRIGDPSCSANNAAFTPTSECRDDDATFTAVATQRGYQVSACADINNGTFDAALRRSVCGYQGETCRVSCGLCDTPIALPSSRLLNLCGGTAQCSLIAYRRYEDCDAPGASSGAQCGYTPEYTSCPGGYYCPLPLSKDDLEAAGILNANVSEKILCNTSAPDYHEFSCCTFHGNILACRCAPGVYCPANTSVPRPCPAGSFCPTSEQIELCGEGNFCPERSVEESSCGWLGASGCPEGSRAVSRNGLLAMYAAVLAGIVLFGSIWRRVYACVRANHRESVTYDGELPPSRPPLPKKIENSAPLDVTFDGIRVVLPSGRVILDGIFGRIQPGHLACIMGGSGAGKTTLLDVLAGHTGLAFSGNVKLNGVQVSDMSRFRTQIGFVHQEDVLHPELSVRQTIQHSARMRLPAAWSVDDVDRHVAWVLNRLQLNHVASVKVGGVGQKTLSGGERRRVSIGVELAALPSLLILDEPTSGLDSFTAHNVCNMLQDICIDANMSIVAAIHSPGTGLFALFATLLLLQKGARGGRTAYFGRSDQAAAVVKASGFRVPRQGESAPEYVVDIASEEPSVSGATSHTSMHRQNALPIDRRCTLLVVPDVPICLADKFLAACTLRWQHSASHSHPGSSHTAPVAPTSFSKVLQDHLERHTITDDCPHLPLEHAARKAHRQTGHQLLAVAQMHDEHVARLASGDMPKSMKPPSSLAKSTGPKPVDPNPFASQPDDGRLSPEQQKEIDDAKAGGIDGEGLDNLICQKEQDAFTGRRKKNNWANKHVDEVAAYEAALAQWEAAGGACDVDRVPNPLSEGLSAQLFPNISDEEEERLKKVHIRAMPGFRAQWWWCLVRAQRQHLDMRPFIGFSIQMFALGIICGHMAPGAPLPLVMTGYPLLFCSLASPLVEACAAGPLLTAQIEVLLMLVFPVMFVCSSVGVATFGLEKINFSREVQWGLRPLAYFLAKIAVDLVRLIATAASFTAGLMIVLNTTRSVIEYFWIVFLPAATGWIVSGWLVGVTCDPQNMFTIAMVVVFLNTFPLAGQSTGIRRESFEEAGLLWISDLSVSRWASEAVMMLEVEALRYNPKNTSQTFMVPELYTAIVEKYHYGLHGGPWSCILWGLTLLVGWTALVALIQWLKSRNLVGMLLATVYARLSACWLRRGMSIRTSTITDQEPAQIDYIIERCTSYEQAPGGDLDGEERGMTRNELTRESVV